MIKHIKTFLSYFSPKMPLHYVYMLQQVEYKPEKFLHWLSRRPNLNYVMYRKKLVLTSKAKGLLAIGYGVLVAYVSLLVLVGLVLHQGLYGLILLTPIVVSLALLLVVTLAYRFAVLPAELLQVKKAEKIFAESKAVKIAVLGSYGKTSFKEMLGTVLSEKLKVAVTPGNMNTSIAHARFANSLEGDEDVIIIEYGEGEPGDIKRFAGITHPNMAILTGIAPNHLDEYKTFDALRAEFIHIKNFVPNEKMYVNEEIGDLLDPFSGATVFGPESIGNWKISDIHVEISGLTFKLKGEDVTFNLSSQLIGRHQVAPLAACAMIAHEFKLSKSQITEGIAKTKPFEHRMQPRAINGAWIIDDTYNGNIEGMKAGLALLHELEAKRKTYVTPGLVDQGEETVTVHQKLAAAISGTDVQVLVLIKNSTTPIITAALQTHNFSGEVIIEDKPLQFYTTLEHRVAAGDIVLMQNDWTDNYS